MKLFSVLQGDRAFRCPRGSERRAPSFYLATNQASSGPKYKIDLILLEPLEHHQIVAMNQLTGRQPPEQLDDLLAAQAADAGRIGAGVAH